MVHLLHSLCRVCVHNTEQAGCVGAGTPAPSSRSDIGGSVLNFRWKKQTTEPPTTPERGYGSASKECEKMFLVEERRNGQRRAEIYMRPDGLFEGRIYRLTSETASEAIRPKAEFEICGVTETLPRIETLVDEGLGL